jgi:hypothetical protein
MPRYLVTGIIAAALATPVLAQARGESRTAPQPSPRVPSTLRLLNTRVPEVLFNETPFEQVLEWLRDLTQVNMVVHWQVLEDAGIKRDKPISLNAKNLRLSQVLWMVMSEAGGQDVKLAYRAEGNLLVLSTDDDLNKEMVVKVYDVNDLLLQVPRFSARPSLDPSQALQQQGQGSGGTNLFQNQEQDEELDRDRGGGGINDGGMTPEAARLIQLIRDTIEPDTWRENGGQGAIYLFRGQLVVRNTILVHQRLGGFLDSGEVSGP